MHSIFALLLIATSYLVRAQDIPIPLICRKGVQMITAPGHFCPNGSTSFGRSGSFVQMVEDAIPGSSAYSVSYSRNSSQNESSTYFIPEVTWAVPAALAALKNYTAACPNTPIVLHGYSQGAVIMGNMVCGASSNGFRYTNPLNSSYAKNIIAFILYGDETRTANQPYDFGNCTVSSPSLPRTKPQLCDAFAPVMASYCIDIDALCCSSANASAPWVNGFNPHWLYPSYFDRSAVRLVVKNYNAYRNATNSTSTTSSSTSTISVTSISTSKTSLTTSTSTNTTKISTTTSSSKTSLTSSSSKTSLTSSSSKTSLTSSSSKTSLILSSSKTSLTSSTSTNSTTSKTTSTTSPSSSKSSSTSLRTTSSTTSTK